MDSASASPNLSENTIFEGQNDSEDTTEQNTSYLSQRTFYSKLSGEIQGR